MTDFKNKCIILGDLWLNYRGETLFEDFIEYNDMGLPLAYMISEGIAEPTELGSKYVDETWDLFMGAMEIEDTGFENLDQVLDAGIKDE